MLIKIAHLFMTYSSNSFGSVTKKTKRALLWGGLCSEPLLALLTLLAFILRKDLHATLWQISLFTMTRPIVGVLAFYWSSLLKRRKDLLRSNLIYAWLFSRAGFLLLPLYPSANLAIICNALFFLFSRAATPALMEILHVNLQEREKQKIFSISSFINFLTSILLGLSCGGLLDRHPKLWPWFFALSSLLSLTVLFLHKKLPITGESSYLPSSIPTISWKERLLSPWIDSYYLMRKNLSFYYFQVGFMWGGFGLMIMTPALTIFYADNLSLSHETLIHGRLIYMGVGYLIANPLWQKQLEKISGEKFTATLCIGFSLFPLLMLLSYFSLFFFYFALFLYGAMQAGSHLIWNLSGTLFAKKEENSAPFTTVNILCLGLRGLFAPLIGSCICALYGSQSALTVGSLCCLVGGGYLFFRAYSQNHSTTPLL